MKRVPEELVEFAGRLADESGAIAMRLFRSGVGFELKADRSPVTIADQQAEAAIRTLISAAYPQHAPGVPAAGLRKLNRAVPGHLCAVGPRQQRPADAEFAGVGRVVSGAARPPDRLGQGAAGDRRAAGLLDDLRRRAIHQQLSARSVRGLSDRRTGAAWARSSSLSL